jgi:hypothetical protein
MDLMNLADALSQARLSTTTLHLVLGNGFSIACQPSFNYRRLLDIVTCSRTACDAFKCLSTADFESVMHSLEAAGELAENYGPQGHATSTALREDAASLRTALIRAIAQIHPSNVFSLHEDAYRSTAQFVALCTSSNAVCRPRSSGTMAHPW